MRTQRNRINANTAPLHVHIRYKQTLIIRIRKYAILRLRTSPITAYNRHVQALHTLVADLHNDFLLWQNEIFFGSGQVKRSFQKKGFFAFCFRFAKVKNNCAGQLGSETHA